MQHRALASVFGLCAIVVLVLAGCAQLAQAPATSPAAEVVGSATRPWDSDQLDATAIDATLPFYADDAVITMTGADGETQVVTGKAAIQERLRGGIELHAWSRVDIVRVQGDTVTTRTEWSDDLTRALGVGPMIGTDVFVVKNGKIASVTSTISNQSRAQIEAALAAEEFAADSSDVAGEWQSTFGSERAHLILRADGTGSLGELSTAEPFERGTFAVAEGQIQWLTSDSTCASTAGAAYFALVTKQGGQPIALRLMLAGDDGCADREALLNGMRFERVR